MRIVYDKRFQYYKLLKLNVEKDGGIFRDGLD